MQTAANCIKRTGMVFGLATGAVLAALWWSRVTAPALQAVLGPGPARPADALIATAATAAWLVALWLLLGMAMEVLAALPGRVGRFGQRVSAAITPALARRLVAGILGVSASTTLMPSQALAAPPAALSSLGVQGPGWSATAEGTPGTPGWVAPAHTDMTPETTTSSPGWVAPKPALRSADVALITGPGWRAQEESEVVVRRGDTLWSIAAAHLGSGASDAEIADAWPRWYAANRDVVGADPDLLLPGQTLQIPNLDEVSR